MSIASADNKERDDCAGEPPTGTWLKRRIKLVRQAIDDLDIGTLRMIAAVPGGFGTNDLRKEAWALLLHTQKFYAEPVLGPVSPGGSSLPKPKEAGPPHPDEHQVLLDTKRSFVTYPKDIPAESKEQMQKDLQSLIVHVLRLYPTLSYFQGYHDIISVLYLTFIPIPEPHHLSRANSKRNRDYSPRSRPSGVKSPERPSTPVKSEDDGKGPSKGLEANEKATLTEDSNGGSKDWAKLRQCAEVVSLCRVRDAMGSSMEPMMGLLKMLQRLLKVADPELAKFSATISPVPTLPFFALSWILCLFSHDIDTLEPVQRMFDFLLARNPVTAIYLAVAILIAKKDQMFRLAKDLGPDVRDDPSLLHPLFSRLPPLFADTPDGDPPPGPTEDEDNPYSPIAISKVFTITDDLMARHPWDGPEIRGKEIMGSGSVVRTFDRESEVDWTLQAAEFCTNREIILPGATEADEEEPEVPMTRKSRQRRSKKGMVIAVGVVAVGVGIALYGYRAGGAKASWTAWWAMIIRSWASRGNVEVFSRQWQAIGRFVRALVREVV